MIFDNDIVETAKEQAAREAREARQSNLDRLLRDPGFWSRVRVVERMFKAEQMYPTKPDKQ